jgi:hypothetical protein
MNSFRFSILLTIFVSLSLLFFAACSSDDEKDEPKLTQAQADEAIQDNAEAIAAVANLVGYQARAAATNGEVTQLEIDQGLFLLFLGGFGKRGVDGLEKMGEINPLNGDDGFFWNGNGCWTIDYDTTDVYEGYSISLSILAQLCFDTWNLLGGPTETTNQMTYMIDFDVSGSFPLDQGSFLFDLGVDRDLTVTGISDYNSGTGNLVVNGSDDENFNISVTSPNGSQSVALNYSNTVNAVTIVPLADYPASGIINFSIGFSANPPIPDYPNFTVAGTITFDGSNVVGVTFAGFTYSLNLLTGQIS